MKNRIIKIILLMLVITSCSGDKLDVDVSDVELNITFDRQEQTLFSGKSPDDMVGINQDLLERGGELYEFYVHDMLRSGSVFDDSISTYLWYFVNDSMMKLVYSNIETQFSDFSEIENRLIDIFKHQKYYLPNAPLPTKIMTYNGAFSFGVISTDSVIGIGIEMYLGPDNKIISEIRFPLYIKEKMHKDYLPIDVAQSWLMTNVIEGNTSETFLSNLIYYGKLKYSLEALMPDLPKHLILRYNKEEYEYAMASEYNIWQYLVDMDWIYTEDMKVKMRFFEESPTTVGIEDSPGRIGQFIGWRMVKSYMDANPDVTLEELLKEESDTKILKAYKPRENE